jgi:predicted RNase H-like nuclease
MTVILGVDTAWTATEPSGVALLAGDCVGWRCLAVAPSYESFIAAAGGTSIGWTRSRFRGSMPNVRALLDASRTLAGGPVDLVSLDMPIANAPFSCRRVADNAISTAFGGRGCSAHSPSAVRPGEIGANLTRQLHDAGYRLVTDADRPPPGRGFIEVYPHPALLTLMKATYRVPYKVQKSRRYWPQQSGRERIVNLLDEFRRIDTALRQHIDGIPEFLPAVEDVPSLSALKRHEDALDALVCGWVAVEFLRGHARACGDGTAANWVPELAPSRPTTEAQTTE